MPRNQKICGRENEILVPGSHEWTDESKHGMQQDKKQWHEVDDEVEYRADANSGALIVFDLHLLLMCLLQLYPVHLRTETSC